MNKNTLFPIIRTILSAAGAYIVGVNLFGHAIDQSLWQIIVGGIMALASIIWSIRDKSLTIEGAEGFLRQAITVGGGLLVSWGKVKSELVAALLALIPVLAPYLQSVLSRNKSAALQTNAVNSFDLKK